MLFKLKPQNYTLTRKVKSQSSTPLRTVVIYLLSKELSNACNGFRVLMIQNIALCFLPFFLEV